MDEPEGRVECVATHVEPFGSFSALAIIAFSSLVVIGEELDEEFRSNISDTNIRTDNTANDARIGISITTERDGFSHTFVIEFLALLRIEIIEQAAILILVSCLEEVVEREDKGVLDEADGLRAFVSLLLLLLQVWVENVSVHGLAVVPQLLGCLDPDLG